MSGMTHVKTSPFYPQSNEKIERWHQSLKRECIRPGVPLSLEDARRQTPIFFPRCRDLRLATYVNIGVRCGQEDVCETSICFY
jgi:putative transposase